MGSWVTLLADTEGPEDYAFIRFHGAEDGPRSIDEGRQERSSNE